MVKLLFLFSIIITLSTSQQNAGIKVSILPNQLDNFKYSYFQYFFDLVQNTPLPTASKASYNISNARIESFTQSADDVITTLQNGNIFVQSKIPTFNIIADVLKGPDFYPNVSFTTANNALYLYLKPFLDNQQNLTWYVSNITLTLNNIRIRAQNAQFRGL